MNGNSQSNFNVGDEVSFSGRFGMRRYVTRSGTILSLENGLAKVDCKQGIHSVYTNQLSLVNYVQNIQSPRKPSM